MIITTQVNIEYYNKALLLWDSVKKYWPYRFVLGCIGFEPIDYDGEWFRIEHDQVKSYRENWPKNRPGFVTMQNGEFNQYIDCDDSELIIQLDADTIMQREATMDEIELFNQASNGSYLLAVRSSNPPTNLTDALINLGGPRIDQYKDGLEWTNSFMIATASRFEWMNILCNGFMDWMTTLTDHHAGIQWLPNVAMPQSMVKILPPTIQCASWYNTFDTTTEDGILKYKGEVVLFNHTK